MRRHLKLWSQFARISLIREMEFKGNFVTQILVEIGWSVVTIFSFEIIFLQTNSIAGWNKAEVYLIYALFRIVSALNSIVLRKNIMRFSFLINSGEFDQYLVKPVDTLFLSTTRITAFDRISQLTIGVILLVYSFSLNQLTLNIWHILDFLILIPAAVLIKFTTELFLVIPIFWLQKLQNITDLNFALMGPARFPRAAFPPLLRHTLTFVIPVMFIAAIPAEIILGKSPQIITFFMVGFALVQFVIMRQFFFFALRHYSSASS